MKKKIKPQPEAQKRTSDAWRNKMRVLLRGRNLSQRKLAKAIGSSDSLVAKWMSGDTGMSFQSAMKVAKVFGVSVDELMSDAPLRPETVASFFDTGGAAIVNSLTKVDAPVGIPVVESGASHPDPQPQETSDMDERRRRLHGLIDAIPPEALEEAAEQAVSWLAQWYSKRYLGSSNNDRTRRGIQ